MLSRRWNDKSSLGHYWHHTFGGMTAGGIHLWVKRRRKSQVVSNPFGDKIRYDLTDLEEKDNEK